MQKLEIGRTVETVRESYTLINKSGAIFVCSNELNRVNINIRNIIKDSFIKYAA